MSIISIRTLTPVHVGSGRAFQGNFEYLYFRDPRQVVVIDDRKVLEVIGEENLDKWISIIDQKRSLLEYLQVRRPGLQPQDVALRVLPVKGTAPTKDQPVREQIHAGNGQPLLPGSSLKGAIRTALLARLLDKRPALAGAAGLQNQWGKFQDQALQKAYFGNDPNHDLLRLLRVADVAFGVGDTVCLQVANLSERGEETYMNRNVTQYAECLPEGRAALAKLQVPEELVKRLQEPAYRQHAPEYLDWLELPKLFEEINTHTRSLLEEELNRYRQKELPDEAGDWVEELERLDREAADCKPGECVLRVGFGAGFHFMTGGWQPARLTQKVQEQIAEVARPRHYRGPKLPLPRSRRMVGQGVPLGFVKLRLLTEEEADQQVGREAAERERVEAEQRQRQQEAERERQEQEAAALAGRQRQEEEARRLAEEAMLPRYYTGKVKSGAQLDAVVVGPDKSNPRMKVFRLYISGPGQEQEVKLNYASDLEPGRVVVVKVTAEQKGRVQSIQFLGYK